MKKNTKTATKKKTKKTIIKLENVWKIYQMGKVTVNALRGLNLEVNRGEFIAIMGPSGSGKSTAMNMIGCLDVPTKGRIILDGKDISKLHESDLAQIRGRKIGFIFQKFNLIPTLTAIENVMLPMSFQGVPYEERLERARKLLTIVDLTDRMHHKPAELSGGQQQRVAIARALANKPEVLLADEPTGNLDSKTGKAVMDLLKKINKEDHTTIVLVTHDEDVAKIAKKVVFLKDGQVQSRK
ncbi:ABC transporter ATP-binding protein [Candidatus Woesearchaeota archaeon]|nr:MAG: ABC transporter ATP-binding protein [Candidatus Woesearchaeota archaeon]